jgi:hypothetical protein
MVERNFTLGTQSQSMTEEIVETGGIVGGEPG